MTEQNIPQSLQNDQVRFKKVLAIYREMLFDQASSKCVRISHPNADEDYISNHVIQHHAYQFCITGLIICGKCARDERFLRKMDFLAYHSGLLPCGICNKRKSSTTMKYSVKVQNTGDEMAVNFTLKLGFELAQKTVHQVVVINKNVLECGDSCEANGDFPICNYDELLSDKKSLTMVCEIHVLDVDIDKYEDEDETDSGSDTSGPLGIMDLIPTLFSDANIDPKDEDINLGDIVLSVEGHKIHCHKLILSTCSNVFKTMFTTDMIEKHSNEIILKDIQLPTLKSLLTFMYSDDVDSDEITTDLLAAAEFYELLKLKDICEDRLITMLDVCNVGSLWLCGYLHNAEKLEFKSTAFMARHWQLLIEDEEVQTICKDYSHLAIMISKLLSSN